MADIFNTSAFAKVPKKNLFNLSRENSFSCDVGQLVPVVCEPLFPGDVARISPAAIVKTAPMLAPVMGSMEFDFHAFVVPLRLLWDEFPRWIFDHTNTAVPPHTRTDYLLNDAAPGTLLDYLNLGLTKNLTDSDPLNIFKILGYLHIWKEFFRDEDLQDYPAFLDDITISDYDAYYQDTDLHPWFTTVRQRCWRKDYFTSARPWPQRGTSPLLNVFDDSASQAPLQYQGKYDIPGALGDNVNVLFPSISLPYSAGTEVEANMAFFGGVGTDSSNLGDPYASGHYGSTLKPGQAANWFVDIASHAQGVSVDMLRALFAMQRFQEIEAISGSRYIEGSLSFWGVRVKDARAQVPEFIGMSSQYISIDEVVQTSESDATVQGHRTGQGSTSFTSRPFRYYATEHALLYVLASVRPKAVYKPALPRYWRQIDQFDFPTPIFQHIGEQEVKQSELDVSLATTKDDLDKTFGYQSRFADVRSSFDEVHGDFLTSLNYWSFFRQFESGLQLDEYFVVVDKQKQSNFNRIFAAPYVEAHHFWVESYFVFKVRREFKYHSVPTLIG